MDIAKVKLVNLSLGAQVDDAIVEILVFIMEIFKLNFSKKRVS